jgi:uncharacterized protein (TIGR03086 family)
MPDPQEGFARAVAGFTRVVHAVGADQWADATPCTDWDVRALVGHVTGEQLWAPPLLAGATVAEIGDRFAGDVLGDDPVTRWDQAAAASVAAFGVADLAHGVVDLSRGPTRVVEYLGEMTADALVHTWDLARAVGADETLDADLVAAVYEQFAPHAHLLAGSGLFDPPVPVPEDAPLQTRLLALCGRAA